MTQLEKRIPAKVNGKRWAAYAAAGAAVAFVGAESAEADITYIVDGRVIGADQDEYLALEGGASINFFHPGGAALVGIFNATNGYLGQIAGANVGGFNYAANLASGAFVSTQAFVSNFAFLADNNGFPNSEFVNVGGFVGFQFDIGSGTQYGWMRVTSAADAPTNTFTVVDYAFADAGEAIFAGQTSAIPEPTSLGLLALGGLGVLASRRRKKVLANTSDDE